MNLKEQIGKLVAKVDGMSLRERALIFFAAAFLVVSLIDAMFLSPLRVKQKNLSTQVVQQQEKMKEIQAQLANLLQAKQADATSPQRERIRLLRQQIADGKSFLQDKRDKLVPPERMAALLEQVLGKNRNLQLVALETLPVGLFIELSPEEKVSAAGGASGQAEGGLDWLMFKHGVKITVRGSYADLMQYLKELEHLPSQMYWGEASLNVVEYPESELTLTVYTLSLDKIWLQV